MVNKSNPDFKTDLKTLKKMLCFTSDTVDVLQANGTMTLWVCHVIEDPVPHSIDDVTTVYLQQTQGIGLSIHLNELLHYSMAHYRACVTWWEF